MPTRISAVARPTSGTFFNVCRRRDRRIAKKTIRFVNITNKATGTAK